MFLALLACSCGGGRNTTAVSEPVSNIIDLTTAFYNPREVRLSELVDSISFIPLETSQALGNNIPDNEWLRFSGDYIMSYDRYFDMNGKYLGRVGLGARGRGPLETFYGPLTAINVGDHFYHMDDKFLEYDLTGRPTGKVRHLFDYSTDGNSDPEGFLSNAPYLYWSGKNFVTTTVDSLYYIDRDFQIVDSQRIPEWNAEEIGTGRSGRFLVQHEDKVVFFVNDTIFHISGTRVEPKWIVNLSAELRPGIELDRNRNQLFIDAFNSGNFRGGEFERLTRGKQSIGQPWETDDYVFLSMSSMEIDLLVPDGAGVPKPYYLFFVKATGETVRVAGEGFVDDILGLDAPFIPKWGTHDEALISSIWPYELHDLIAERRRTGTPVDPRLEALAQNVKEGDNPILIIAHLK